MVNNTGFPSHCIKKVLMALPFYTQQYYPEGAKNLYLRLHSVGHNIMANTTRKTREESSYPNGLVFSISSKTFLYAQSHIQNNIYHSQLWNNSWDEKYLNESAKMNRSNNPPRHEWTLCH